MNGGRGGCQDECMFGSAGVCVCCMVVGMGIGTGMCTGTSMGRESMGCMRMDVNTGLRVGEGGDWAKHFQPLTEHPTIRFHRRFLITDQHFRRTPLLWNFDACVRVITLFQISAVNNVDSPCEPKITQLNAEVVCDQEISSCDISMDELQGQTEINRRRAEVTKQSYEIETLGKGNDQHKK